MPPLIFPICKPIWVCAEYGPHSTPHIANGRIDLDNSPQPKQGFELTRTRGMIFSEEKCVQHTPLRRFQFANDRFNALNEFRTHDSPKE